MLYQMMLAEKRSVSRRDHRASFDHEDYRSFRRSGSMQYALRDCKSLLRGKLDRLIFQIDEEPAINNIKELIFIVVFVPMEFTFDNAKPHDAVVDSTQRLIEPILLAFFLKPVDVNQLESAKSHVGVDGIRELGDHT